MDSGSATAAAAAAAAADVAPRPRRVASTDDDDDEVVLFVGFNQDASCVSVGTSSSFRVFSLHPFALCDEGSAGSGVRHVEMLFSSALVALVGSSDDPSFSPRRLRLLNTRTKKRVGELSFNSSIVNVKLHEQRLVALTARQAHVFELPTMKLLTSLDTPANVHGVCELSSSSDRCFLALPASEERGDVLLYDCLHLHASSKVHAHANSLRLIVFNAPGTMLCTASSKGTVLRVFSVPSGERLYSFRRGLQFQTPHSAGFSPSSSLLCFSSEADTVHVFSLSASVPAPTSTSAGARLTDLLPSALTEMVEPIRSVARIRLKDHCGPAQCRFLDDHRIVLVTERDFHVRIYDIVRSSSAAASEPSELVEYCCRLISEHALVRSPQQAIGASLFQRQNE